MADNPIKIPVGSDDTPHQRFIRTFERDAAALQAGGIPDFIAIEEPVDTPQELKKPSVKQFIERAAPPAPTAPAFHPTAIVRPPEPRPEPIPEPEPEPLPPPPPPPPPRPIPPPPPPPPPPKPTVRPQPIHTFTSDFVDRIRSTKASTATVLAAQGDVGPTVVAEPRNYSIFYIIGGILLLTLGAGAAYGVAVYLHAPLVVPFQPTTSAPIFVNERASVSGTGEALIAAIQKSANKELARNSVRFLTLTATTTPVSDVFHALELPAPNVLLRNVNSEGGMTGILNAGGTSAPFFILKVSSYGETFAGMLAWEPRMGLDLRELFPPKIASSTQTIAVFKDQVIANHDARVARDQAGNDIVVYGYWDPSTLIIARDDQGFGLIIERLSTSKTEH